MVEQKAREDDPNAKEQVNYKGQKSALLRDTTLGLVIRYLSGNKVLQYPEEKYPDYYKKKYSEEAQDEKQREVDQANRRSEENWRRENPRDAAAEDRRASSDLTLNESPDRQKDANGSGSDSEDNADGRQKKPHHDEERGQDVNLVNFEPQDPENPMNWSFGKKAFTTGMLCVLTFSIYIGSAIYSAGATSVEEQFHVSESVAVLGLSAFVAGYGLGPMLWSPLSEIPAIGRNPICKQSLGRRTFPNH